LSRRTRPRPAPAKVSATEREVVARRVGEAFNKLNPEEKRRFSDETLTVLVNMTPKQMGKLLGKFIKRGRPSSKDLETVNQLIIVFLYSVKPEFQLHYATMVYKRLGQPLPENLPRTLEEIRKLRFIHAGVSQKIYSELYRVWEKIGFPVLPDGEPNYDVLFNHLMTDR